MNHFYEGSHEINSPKNDQFFFKEVNGASEAFAFITEWVHLTPGCEF